MFAPPRTISRPRIGPPAQYTHRYTLLSLTPLQSPSKFSSLAPQEERGSSMSP